VVDATRELVEPHSIAAKMNFECGELECLQIADRLNAYLLETGLGDFADTWNTTDGKRWQEAVKVLWLNDEEAVRLAPGGGNFCKKLVSPTIC
jgi:hypothetical protein